MKITTSIKIDKDTKEEAVKLSFALGLSLSSVINASLKQFVMERRIAFSVEPELNNTSKKILRKALKDVKNKKDLVGPYESVSALKKSLLS